MLAVTIWYLVSARRTFKGPVRTIEFAERRRRPSPARRRRRRRICRRPVADTLTVIEPATEAVLEEVPRAGVEDVDRAVAARQGGLPGLARGGARRPGGAAAALADAVAEHREELALIEARNAGKPIGDARGEMDMVAQTIGYYAGAPERLLGDSIPVAGGQAWTVREPLGVVGLIVPWNFPLVDRRPGSSGRRWPRATRSSSSPPS